jgi:predicted CoA-binding protein
MATAVAEQLKVHNRRADIEEFFTHKRIAIVGVSRQTKDFTRTVMHALEERGYEMVPVNPAAPDIGGFPCYARVQDIAPPVDAALLMTTPAVTEQVVRDCAEAGVTHVWMYGISGDGGAVSPWAVEFCRAQGMSVVAGECPFMFLEHSGFPHGVHRFINRVLGKLPK